MAQRIKDHEEQQSELSQKLRKLGKRLDWLERAKRGEERPLLESYHDTFTQDDEKYFKDQIQTYLKTHRETYDRELELKNRLTKMMQDKNKFEEALFKRRQEEYNKVSVFMIFWRIHNHNVTFDD